MRSKGRYTCEGLFGDSCLIKTVSSYGFSTKPTTDNGTKITSRTPIYIGRFFLRFSAYNDRFLWSLSRGKPRKIIMFLTIPDHVDESGKGNSKSCPSARYNGSLKRAQKDAVWSRENVGVPLQRV